MRDAYLATYLNDHLGASVAGMELARRCRSNNGNSGVGQYLESLLPVLHDDQIQIRKLLRRLGAGESTAKKLGGWMLEKAGRLKLNNALFRYSDLSRLIELEALMVFLRAQVGMWSVLGRCCSEDARFEGIDFAWTSRQLEAMLEAIEQHRLRAAELAFVRARG